MSCFSKIYEKSNEYTALRGIIKSQSAPVGAVGLPDINKVHTVHSLCEELNKKAFIVVPDEAGAVRFYENLSQLQTGVLLYPKREFTFL